MSNFEDHDFSFDPGAEEGTNFDLIPVGVYVAEIIEAGLSTPKSGLGSMLNLTWRIIEGDYEGRQIWDRLCYLHPNLQTQSIARKRLKDVCDALGILQHFTDPEILKYKPARIKVGIETDRNGQYDDQNRVKRVYPLDDEGKTSPEPARPAPRPVTGGPGLPWRTGA